jgi:antitoxin CptB
VERVAREKLKWRCRRGLLELDLVLERFLQRHGERMTEGETAVLGELLALPDRELWAIVSGASERYEARQRSMVERLRSI